LSFLTEQRIKKKKKMEYQKFLEVHQKFSEATELTDIYEIYSDFPPELFLEISDQRIAELWHSNKALTVTFDRSWACNELNPFIADKFPDLKYLHLNCQNYMCGPRDNSWSFIDFPLSVQYFFVNTSQFGISLDNLENTNLVWLMIDSDITSNIFNIPDTLQALMIAVRDDTKEIKCDLSNFERHYIGLFGSGGLIANTGLGKYLDYSKNSMIERINDIMITIHRLLPRPKRDRQNMYVYLRKN
jgi:hypothetical protein